jgi:hypothetical protein
VARRIAVQGHPPAKEAGPELLAFYMMQSMVAKMPFPMLSRLMVSEDTTLRLVQIEAYLADMLVCFSWSPVDSFVCTLVAARGGKVLTACAATAIDP